MAVELFSLREELKIIQITISGITVAPGGVTLPFIDQIILLSESGCPLKRMISTSRVSDVMNYLLRLHEIDDCDSCPS